MPLYLDTSALAKRYIPEGTSTQTVRMIMSRSTSVGGFIVSSIVKPEVVSAFTTQIRANGIPRQRQEAITRLPSVVAEFQREFGSGRFRVVAVSDPILDIASELIAENPTWNIGAADAIHLATALEVKRALDEATPLVFVTADRGLANAAKDSGLPVFDPLYHRPERLREISGLTRS
jgi:predicted nucleic acid-binding protein